MNLVVCSLGTKGWAVWMEKLLLGSLMETQLHSHLLQVGVKAVRSKMHGKCSMELSFLTEPTFILEFSRFRYAHNSSEP